MLTKTLKTRMTRSLRKASRGFSLLEAMISVFILSFGMLGIAALQINSIQNNQSAYMSTQATILADEIVDRMRANRQAALSGSYNLSITAASPSSQNPSRAESDLAAWRTSIARDLPIVAGEQGGAVLVQNRIVTITIRWIDARWQANANDQVREFVYTTQL